MAKVLILILFPLPVLGSLIITEVQIEGDLADNDYIKIHNPLDYDLDASGYRLRKKTSTGSESSIRVFPKETIVPAKDYLLWANSKQDFHLKIGADLWSTAYLAKNNSIALFDPEKNLLDSLSWGQSEKGFFFKNNFEDNPQANQALKRKKENSEYQNDFYLYPEIKEKESIVTETIEIDAFKPEIEKKHFLRALLLSLASGFFVLGLKKIT